MSELTKALLKVRRAKAGTIPDADIEKLLEDVAEEMADVFICLDKLLLIFNNNKEVDFWLDFKTERQKKRLIDWIENQQEEF